MAEFDIYQDAPNYPHRDERELNVVGRINELSDYQYRTVEDDSTEEGELKRAINKINLRLSDNRNTLNTLSTRVGTVPEGHTLCDDISTINENISALSQSLSTITDTITNLPKILRVVDIEGLSQTEVISTTDLYNALKTQMDRGDIFIGQVNLSTDGPGGFSAEGKSTVGIFAYAVIDGVEGEYARVYMIATSKTSSDIYSYQSIEGNATWVKVNV